jgi:hypothetical protein
VPSAELTVVIGSPSVALPLTAASSLTIAKTHPSTPMSSGPPHSLHEQAGMRRS